MSKFSLLMTVALLGASAGYGQEKALPEKPRPQPAAVRGGEERESKRSLGAWVALSAGTYVTGTLDVNQTNRVRSLAHSLGGTFHEQNPFLRPFAGNSGSLFAADLAIATGTNWLGNRMRKAKHPVLRALWPVPQATYIALSLRGYSIGRSSERRLRNFQQLCANPPPGTFCGPN